MSSFLMVDHLGWSRRACVSLEFGGDNFPPFFIRLAFVLGLLTSVKVFHFVRVGWDPPSWMTVTRMRQYSCC